MYPFGSGMPQPHATPASGYNSNQQSGNPAGVPFGAGWVAPPSHQQASLHYQQLPPQNGAAPYPNHSNAPYPGQSNAPYPSSTAPYPTSHAASSYPSANASYPSANPPYPNSSAAPYPNSSAAPYPNSSTAPYPASHSGPYPSASAHSAPYSPNANQHSAPYPGSSYPHNPQQNLYPSVSSPQHHSHQQSNTHYTHVQGHPSYNATHGYTPVRTSGGFQSPAGNMQHCFEELANKQGHPIHHHVLNTRQPIGFVPDDSFVHRGEEEEEQQQQEQEQEEDNYDYPTNFLTAEDDENGTPTVLPAQQFDPVKDAHDLRKAMKGFGTDEDALINIICRRSNEQRQEIQRQYKTHFGKDLIEDIKSETSGNFEKLLVGLLRPIVDFYCAELNDAMAGIGTDEDVLIEILCTLSNSEIHIIKNQYLRLYGAHLESELKSETSGNFKRLLVSLCAAARDESGHTDPVTAQTDARELLKAGELRVGTDESTFNMILCQRNYQQLKLIFQEYEHMTGHSLEKAVKKEFSGDIMEGLIAIYRCVTNKHEYFASRLHKSMAGIGTNDKQLIRVVITRSEIDMVDIKTAFERVYGKSLKSWIKGDTSGHYKHALYAVVGEERSK